MMTITKLKNTVILSDTLLRSLFRVLTAIINTFLRFFWLVFLCTQSIAAPDSQLLKKLDIQRGLFSDSYKSFDVNGQPTIYVLQENTTAITRGTAVLIADNGVPLVGQEGFAALSGDLNKIGWVTILLSAPDIELAPANEPDEEITNQEETKALKEKTATDTTTNNKETEQPTPTTPEVDLDINKSAVTILDKDAFNAHEQKLIALLQKAHETSQQYPGFFLVISKGTSAAWLSKIYAEKKLKAPDALVVISPYWPDRKLNLQLPAWIAKTPMPTLDLYSNSDNSWARKTVNLRQIAAVKSLKLQYRQRELLGVNLQKQQSAYISKEIYGWISHMGW